MMAKPVNPGVEEAATHPTCSSSPATKKAESAMLRRLNNYTRHVQIGTDSKPVSEWIAWCGETRKRKRAVSTLEQILGMPEALIIDADLVEVLRFIARHEPLDEGQDLFSTLVKMKSFSCTALRLQFDKMLEVEDVLRLLDFSFALVVSHVDGGEGAKDVFDKVLELCNCLLEASSHKLSWRRECKEELETKLCTLNKMVETCGELTKLRAASEAIRVLPKLFSPPRTDYSVQRVKVKRVELPDVQNEMPKQ